MSHWDAGRSSGTINSSLQSYVAVGEERKIPSEAQQSGFVRKRRGNGALRVLSEAGSEWSIVCPDDAARWSSGQDGGLSRRKREFDSPTGHHFPLDRRGRMTYNLIVAAKAVMIVGVD